METATRPSPLMNPRYPLAPMASPAKGDVGKVEKRWKMAELFADREVQRGGPRVPPTTNVGRKVPVEKAEH